MKNKHEKRWNRSTQEIQQEFQKKEHRGIYQKKAVRTSRTKGYNYQDQGCPTEI